MAGKKQERIEPTIRMPESVPPADDSGNGPAGVSSVGPQRLSIDPADRPLSIDPADRPPTDEVRRPVGLTVLALLLVFGGVGLFIVEILAFERFLNALHAIGISALSLFGQMFALSALYVVAGVQVWEGKKWGWILTMAVLLHGVATSLQILALALAHDIPVALQYGATVSPYVKFAFRALGALVFILYLFRAPVLAFFGITRKAAFTYLGMTAIILMVIVVLLSLAG